MADWPDAIPDFTGEIGDNTTPLLGPPNLPAWAQHISDEVTALAAHLGPKPLPHYARSFLIQGGY